MKYVQVYVGNDNPSIQSIYYDNDWMDYVGGKETLEKYCYIDYYYDSGDPIIKPTWYDSFVTWLEDIENFLYDITDEEYYTDKEADEYLDSYASDWNTTKEMVLEIIAAYDYEGCEEFLNKRGVTSRPDDYEIDYLYDIDTELVFYIYGKATNTSVDHYESTSMDGKERVVIDYIVTPEIDPYSIANVVLGDIYGVGILEFDDDTYNQIVNSDNPTKTFEELIYEGEQIDFVIVSDNSSLDIPYTISAEYNEYGDGFTEV